MSRPTAAPAHFPYRHRTMAEVMAAEERAHISDMTLIAGSWEPTEKQHRQSMAAGSTALLGALIAARAG